MSMPENSALAEIIATIFPEALPDIAALEQHYPPRDLPAGAMVTRIGPSPTGFMHIGTLYVGMLCRQFAAQSGGAAYIRIEDTDKKREVEGAAGFISEAFDYFGIAFDEGRGLDGVERGAYGPYTQSQRMAIYQAYTRHLMERDLAYPCFATPEELDDLRRRQEARSMKPGYYGRWAVWRYRSPEEALAALKEGRPYVIRLRSNAQLDGRINVRDMILGEREIPENDQDIVIMKSDRLPTYHLAHVVDDHLMRTTHVIRGDEWFSSLPIHIQLFGMLGWTPPAYAHIAPINKIDGNSRRKLSKRKDPEASVSYFIDLGYPPESVLEYLLNLANSNFEDWRKEHPADPWQAFDLTFEKLANSSGPLFDFVKLDRISRDVVARFSADQIYGPLLAWAEKHDPAFAAQLSRDPDYARRILSIERDGQNVRKDIGKWADVKPLITFFFDDAFDLSRGQAMGMVGSLTEADVQQILTAFAATWNPADGRDEWFAKIKQIARDCGFAEKAGDYKKNPTAFKGGLADMVKLFRVLLTGSPQSPDLYAVMQTMGEARVRVRLGL